MTIPRIPISILALLIGVTIALMAVLQHQGIAAVSAADQVGGGKTYEVCGFVSGDDPSGEEIWDCYITNCRVECFQVDPNPPVCWLICDLICPLSSGEEVSIRAFFPPELQGTIQNGDSIKVPASVIRQPGTSGTVAINQPEIPPGAVIFEK